jgi:hypothetical protein
VEKTEAEQKRDVLNPTFPKTIAQKTEPPPSDHWWSVTNAMTISASVLVFGIAVMVIAALMMRRGRSADNTLKMLGTLLIIISAVFLVVAGYSDTQIAPVMGLLGTIAGYLLGKGSVQEADVRQRDAATTGGSRNSPPPPVSPPPPSASPPPPSVATGIDPHSG